MADPGTWIGIAGLTMGAVSAVGQGQAAAQADRNAASQAQSQAAMANYNAQVDAQQAVAIANQTKYKQEKDAEEGNRQAARLRANLSASGAVPSAGTPLLLQASQAAENDLNNAMIGYQGQIAEGQASSQGVMDTMQGQLYANQAQAYQGKVSGDIMSGYMGAGTSLLKGFGSLDFNSKPKPPSMAGLGTGFANMIGP